MYEKGNICKSGEGGNDSATNNGTAFSSTKQRSCLFFFDEEQSGKRKWSGEYFGIRPYVDGDSMKLIHWKLTGKTDEYMVKEVEVPMMRMPLIFSKQG